jgi:hypothetical protein
VIPRRGTDFSARSIPVAAVSEYGRDGSVIFRMDIEAFVSRNAPRMYGGGTV